MSHQPDDPAAAATARIGDILATAEREVAQIIAAAEQRSADDERARLEALVERAAVLDRRQADLDGREHVLADRERALGERSQALADRERVLDARGAAFSARRTELAEIAASLLAAAVGTQAQAHRLSALPALDGGTASAPHAAGTTGTTQPGGATDALQDAGSTGAPQAGGPAEVPRTSAPAPAPDAGDGPGPGSPAADGTGGAPLPRAGGAATEQAASGEPPTAPGPWAEAAGTTGASTWRDARPSSARRDDDGQAAEADRGRPARRAFGPLPPEEPVGDDAPRPSTPAALRIVGPSEGDPQDAHARRTGPADATPAAHATPEAFADPTVAATPAPATDDHDPAGDPRDPRPDDERTAAGPDDAPEDLVPGDGPEWQDVLAPDVPVGGERPKWRDVLMARGDAPAEADDAAGPGADAGEQPADSPDKLDSARLVALSMAAEGRSREEVETIVRDQLGIRDHEALLDYVFGISAPSSIVPSWPPRRRRRP